MKIALLKKEDITTEVQDQISALFKQLAPNKNQIDLEDIFKDKNDIHLAYCIENGEIIGIASMCIYTVISGKKAWVEDVVVHENARGKGLGRKLMNKLLEVAKEKELTEVLLFSAENRVAAKQLYEDLGFVMNASKLYKLPIENQ
jgi:phosphinothricin acetyltransferase